MFKISVTSRSFGKFVDDGLKILGTVGEVNLNPYGRALREGELIEELRDADAVILGADSCTARVIEASKRLRVIAKHGAGYDNIDLGAATTAGKVVTFSPSFNADSVAEFTIGLLISLARRIPQADRSTKEGRWEAGSFVGDELNGKVLGIIGLGSIGSRVALRAMGFGLKVVYFDVRRDEQLEKVGVSYGNLEAVLATSDFLTLHTTLAPDTVGLLSAERLRLMKPGAYVINTARGKLIDEGALMEALRDGRLKGAALDVRETEPPDPTDPLHT